MLLSMVIDSLLSFHCTSDQLSPLSPASGISSVKELSCTPEFGKITMQEDESTTGGSSLTDFAAQIDNDSTSSNAELQQIRVIWDCDYIEKSGRRGSSEKWTCKWCGLDHKRWNASKALYHVLKLKGNYHVKNCKANIPKAYYQRYLTLLKDKSDLKTKLKRAASRIECNIDEHNSNAALSLESKRIRRSSTSHSASFNLKKHIASSAVSTSSLSSTGPNLLQAPLTGADNQSASSTSKLTMAIADLIHAEGLPFSLTEKPRFKNVLKLARCVTSSYKPPSRMAVNNELLTLNHEKYCQRNQEKLMLEAETYGLTFLGDGATIKKMPLVNILCSGKNSPVAVLEVVDCSDHMSVGGKKNAEFIANIFLPHIQRLDPNKTLTDCVFFDGASNVQKGGRILEAKYPRISVLHGVEHVVSLFFSDVARIPQVHLLIAKQKRRYNTFGSGAIHGAHAIFSTQAKIFNNGKQLGLCRASDTRMAGYFMAMHRDLRLRKALESTVASAAFATLTLKPFAHKAVDDVKSALHWRQMYYLLRVLFPSLCLLRLADSNRAGMDKVYYYTQKTRAAIERSIDVLDDIENFPRVTQRQINALGSLGNADDNSSGGEDYSADDTDDTSDEDEQNNNLATQPSVNSLSSQIMKCWEKREKSLHTDFAIVGWMLSVMPDIREDVRENENGEHRLAVERLLMKFFSNMPREMIDQKIDKFWTEYEKFKAKMEPYNRQHIWNSPDCKNNTHEWHKKYSLPFTSVLGYVACRVTSKILGIGACERAWGDVKRLKAGQRSKTSSEVIEKQSVIYTTACIEAARLKRQELGQDRQDTNENSILGWNDEDIMFDAKLQEWGVDVDELKRAPTIERQFRGWLEDWEKDLLKHNDPVSEARLLEKYKGLAFHDIDQNITYMVYEDNLEYRMYRGGGWCVIGVPPEYNGNNDEELYPYLINDNLIEMIMDTTQPENLNVKKVQQDTPAVVAEMPNTRINTRRQTVTATPVENSESNTDTDTNSSISNANRSPARQTRSRTQKK